MLNTAQEHAVNHPNARQSSVGLCPVCGLMPTWFNNVPLTAYCWGSDSNPHPGMERIVPGTAQPYGAIDNTKWRKSSS
jgi:hypothetical protein